jgi:D-glycero-beta-D-manno-heptose 1-phosphate adenylyltransferase
MGKLLTKNEAASFRKNLKEDGKTVVFTNGCFDIIHTGHIRYLFAARKLGGALIVGLNSDSSTRRLKGEERPVYPEDERAEILCSIEAVDAVVIFEEDTPLNIISALIPDILVKGGDWSVDNIVGGDVVVRNGGRVLTVEYQKEHSTTLILNKIGRSEK